jgi:CRP/FNR family transcriptional regulator
LDGSPRRFPHGRAIVRQGDPASSVCVVLTGAVRLSAVLPSGREVVVGLLGPGDVFGEAALLGGGPSPVEARAVGEARLAVLTVASIDAVVHQSPATASELLRLLAARLHRTSAALEEALAHDVPTRVSRRLVELARTHGVPHPSGVRLALPLTQEDIGRMVGASRESVNKCLGALTSRGLVRIVDRRYVIPDPEALARAAEGALT